MRLLLFTLFACLFLSVPLHACDKCNRVQTGWYAQPYAAAPFAVNAAPVPYAVPAMVNAPSQLSFVPSSTVYAPSPFAVSGFAPVSVLSPTTYSTTLAATSTQAYFAPSTLLVPSAYDSFNAQSLSQQGLLDSLIGSGRPAACEMCRLIGCESSGGGGSARDPLTELKDTIKGIGELIRSIKGLEKDIKDSLSSEVESEQSDVQIAELTRLRDEMRAMNVRASQTQLASDTSIAP